MALNPRRRSFYTLQKVASCHANYNSIIKNGGHRARFLSYKRLKLKLRVFLAGHIVTMVAYCVTKIIPTCLPVIRQVFDAMIDPPKSTSWKVIDYE